MHSLSYGNEFDLQDNEHASNTHFHMKGCAPGLVLKQRQKATRKWPIENRSSNNTRESLLNDIQFSDCLPVLLSGLFLPSYQVFLVVLPLPTKQIVHQQQQQQQQHAVQGGSNSFQSVDRTLVCDH